MIVGLPLACAGVLVLLVTGIRAIMYAIRPTEVVDPREFGSLILLGLIGGAALTPLIEHLGW